MNSKFSSSTGSGVLLAVIFASVLPTGHAAEPADGLKTQAVDRKTSATTAGPNTVSSSTNESVFNTERLKPFFTTTDRYHAQLTPSEELGLQLHFRLKFDFGWSGFPMGPLLVITPGRVPQNWKNVANTVQRIDAEEFRNTPSVTLDGALRSVPDFSLFSRRDSSSGQFRDQGVLLRGLGARVLLDGVPLNNPFGGWVAWAEVPQEGLHSAEIVPGGGATAWGDGTLGGVVQFFTLPASGKIVSEPGMPNDGGPPDPNLNKQVVRQATQLATTFGEYGTRGAEFVSAQPTDRGVLQILGRLFSADGFPVVAPGQRGPIDRTAWSRQGMLGARWRQPLGENLEITATIRDFRESGGEGTPDQQNRLHGDFASVSIAGAPSASFAWNGVAYLQHHSYVATFTAVNAARSTETPLISEFAVPATAFGASWTGLWRNFGQGRTVAGADLNFMCGEAREHMVFSNGTFTREIVAGGDQSIVGFFVSHDQLLAPTVRGTIGARLDAWNDADDHRRETDLSSGAVLSDDRYPADSGVEISPSIGVVWQPVEKWRIRANAQESFRRPTLGERYETFGRNFIVSEPNPELRIGHNTSVEVGVEHRPVAAILLGATAFRNELRDSLGELTIVRGSGGSALVDSLPAGYFGQKRINLDRARVRGLKLSVGWHPDAVFSLDASLLVNDATILRSSISPALAGKRMAEVSRRISVISAKWRAPRGITFGFRARFLGRQYVDDENTLRLGEALVADLGVTYAVTTHAELYLTAENLTNAAVETSRSVGGVFNTGSPRMVLGGLRLNW